MESNRYLSSSHIRFFAISTFLIFAILFLWLRLTSVHGLDRFGNPFLPDLAQFYVAGELAKNGAIHQIYNAPMVWQRINEVLKVGQETGTYFFYPPFVAWLCAPLAFFSYPTAATLYFIFSLILAVTLSWIISKTFLDSEEEAINACLLFLASVPFWRCLLFGQNGFISLALMWIFYRAWMKKQFFLSGLFLSLGSYKPQLFFGLWIWLLLFGPISARCGLFSGGIFFICLGSIGGIQLWKQWIGMLQKHHDLPGSENRMHSLHNAFQLLFPQGEAKWMQLGLIALIFALWITILFKLRFDKSTPCDISFSLTMALLGWNLLTPRLYQYDMVICLPLLIGCWNRLKTVAFPFKRILFPGIVLSFYFSDFAALGKIPLLTMIMLGAFLFIAFGIMMNRKKPAEVL